MPKIPRIFKTHYNRFLMARIRTIKPSYFKNEQLADLPMSVRLLFIGLWTLADKEGRLEDRPKRIKADVFPYDNVDVEKELSRLQSAGFIKRYEVGEMKVISINNFTKHQRITGSEAAADSELPPPPDNQGSNTGNTLETLWKHFGNTQDDRKGKEGKGKEYMERKGDAGAENGENEIIDEGKTENESPPTSAPPPRSITLPEQAIINEKCNWSDSTKALFIQLCATSKWKKKELPALEKSIKQLKPYDEMFACELMDRAIANGWQGVVYDNTDSNYQKWLINRNGNTKTSSTTTVFGPGDRDYGKL